MEQEEKDGNIADYVHNIQMLLSSIITISEITKNRLCDLFIELSKLSSIESALNNYNVIMEELHDFAADLHNTADVIVEICDAMDKLNEKLQSNG